MQYVNGLDDSLVVNFLRVDLPKGAKFEIDYYFDEMCNFGWIYDVIVKNKHDKLISRYHFNIDDFSFIGTISKKGKVPERFDYSDTWQEYVYQLIKTGLLKPIKGNQRTYKEDCDKENEINKKHTNNL